MYPVSNAFLTAKAMAVAAGGDESVEAYEKRMKEIRKDLYH